jgi:hypothetical protein
MPVLDPVPMPALVPVHVLVPDLESVSVPVLIPVPITVLLYQLLCFPEIYILTKQTATTKKDFIKYGTLFTMDMVSG